MSRRSFVVRVILALSLTALLPGTARLDGTALPDEAALLDGIRNTGVNMRSVIATAAIVMAATFVQIDGISILPLAAQDRVATVLAEEKKALGGEDKVAGLKGLTAALKVGT